jgi:DNA repair protein RadC
MPRGERYHPYQLPFDFGAQSLEIAQHVRVLKEPYALHTPADAAQYLMTQVYFPFEQFKQEHLYVLLLNQKQRITHDVLVYIGTVNAMQVRVAELFREAVKQNAPSIILSHNHPSGAPEPSPEDIRVSEIAAEAGGLLQIELLDHIIVGNQTWFSLKEHGIGLSSP